MEKYVLEKYQRWLNEKSLSDVERKELKELKNNEKKLKNALLQTLNLVPLDLEVLWPWALIE